MSPTVADVLALPVIQQGAPEVLAADGLDRAVRWLHSSDLPDLTNLLQGGELVLTTGAALRREPRRYLERIAAAGAVGVVVELGEDRVPLPPAASRAAADLGLALVGLHRRTRFVEVTEEVHRRIVAAQYQEVAFARRVHEEFTSLTMQRAVPAEIVTTAANLLGAPVVLEDLLHQALAAASTGPTTTLLENWERRSRLDGGQEEWVSRPVGRGEDQWARLVVIAPGVDDARVTMVLERAAQALVMHRMAERGQVDLVRQAQAGLVEDVLRGRVRTEKEALVRARALGMREGVQYVPMATQIAVAPSGTDPVTAQKRQGQVLDVVARSARAQGRTAIFSARAGGEIAMVVPAPRREGLESALEALGRAMRRDVAHDLELSGLVLGVGPVKDSLVEAIDGIDAALHVAGVAASLRGRDQVCFRVSDIRLRGLIAQLWDDARVQRFAEGELRQLIADDLATGQDGVAVLRGYLELGGNKTLLARRLHVSRPALYTRLERLERVLGVDLDDGESRASLHVAMLVLEMRGAGGGPRM